MTNRISKGMRVRGTGYNVGRTGTVVRAYIMRGGIVQERHDVRWDDGGVQTVRSSQITEVGQS